ncbi:MAG: hypothetical protein ABH828_00305 [archaeon]
MKLNTLDKNFFKSDVGKRMATKIFGYQYEEKKVQKPEPISEPRVEAVEEPKTNGLENTIVQPDFKSMISMPTIVSETKLNSTLNLHDLVNFYQNKGIVGEENLLCSMTIAAVNGSSFGVEGYSGSGKTFIVDKLIEILPDVYQIQQSSNLAVFYDMENINGSKFIYIPELQKAMKNKNAAIIEVIKDLTEGKDSNRIVTQVKKNNVTEYSIKSGVSIIYTLAIENNFKKDSESSRRLIRFKTDSSQEHLDEIHNYKAKQRYSIGETEIEKKVLESRVTKHLEQIIGIENVNIIDPFSNYLVEMIPKTQKSVGYIDHYYSLLDGCAKFHFNERQKVSIDGQIYMLTNLEDHFNVFNMYFKEFIQTLKDMSNEEDRSATKPNIMEPDWKVGFGNAYSILQASPAVDKLRQTNPSIVNNWFDSQIKNGIVGCLDYKTGENIEIINLNTVEKNGV